MYDYIVIGTGIVGSFIAWELSKYKLNVLVLEKENDIANGQTIANSGIIHSGHDPEEDTLKAKLCVRGNELYKALEEELKIPLRKTGAFVVANTKEDVSKLKTLQKRAFYNGVKEAFILNKEQALKEVPNLNDDVEAVLSLPSTMVTFPWEVCFNLLENAGNNGVKVLVNHEVTNILKDDGYYEVLANGKKFKTKGVINAAGVHTDFIASFVEEEPPFNIIPRRGEYFVISNHVSYFLDKVLYPLPGVKGKGVLLTPQVHGEILVGPNAEEIKDKDDLSTTKEGLDFVKRESYVQAKDIPYFANIRTFAGIRASSTYKDFYIKESKNNERFYHLGGIDSPGLTAAPAISEYLMKMILEKYPVDKKENFIKYKGKPKSFKELNNEQRKKIIEETPLNGRIVCKCEKVTEQEIIDAIKSVVGNDTIKGIKKRTRAGAGICQGGYCENAVLKIIARETNKKVTDINYYETDSQILKEETKGEKK